jgi:GNAT superfamily N-acetyltransferase
VDAAVAIRPLRESDLDAIVELSLRAWEPVFESLRAVLGDAIFARLHQPDWRTVQAEAVRSSCTREERDVFVAVAGEKPVGFATVAMNAFHDGMGVVDMIAVDPAFQRRGIATALMNRLADHMREHGMDIAVVETGGDPGHAPARAMYERSGYTALPVVRYFELLRR